MSGKLAKITCERINQRNIIEIFEKLKTGGITIEKANGMSEEKLHEIEHHEQNKDYFACIIDWKMPEMDGVETTRAIRKAVGPDVSIIIISAYDWSDIEQSLHDNDCQDDSILSCDSKHRYESEYIKETHIGVKESFLDMETFLQIFGCTQYKHRLVRF